MKRTFLLNLMFLALFSFGSFAQNINVKGKVTDENGEPLPGVSIVQANTSKGTVSDIQGNYSISVPGNAVLEYSFIGLANVSENVNNRTVINVVLSHKVTVLEEVVAIGYGSIKKSDLSGSVISVSSDDIGKQNISTFEQALQGRAAGVNFTQSDFSPDGGVSVQIRGSNSMLGGTEPLFVVDGFPIEPGNVQAKSGDNFSGAAPNMMSFVNPSDIESIEILKDASATAIYGSRGANGVILITTKSGSTGRSTVSFGYSMDYNTPSNYIKLLSPKEYSEYQNRMFLNEAYAQYLDKGLGDGKIPTIEDLIAEGANGNLNRKINFMTPYLPADSTVLGTDWQSEILQSSLSHNYDFSISGGTNDVKYRVGISYKDVEGIVLGSDFERLTLSGRLDAKVAPKFRIQYTTNFSKMSGNRTQVGIDNSGDQRSVMNAALRFSPLKTPGQIEDEIDEKGELISSDDPYTYATQFKDVHTRYVFLNNLDMAYSFNNYLTARIKGGIRLMHSTRDMYIPKSTIRGSRYFDITGQRGGLASYGANTSESYFNDLLLEYNRKYGVHSINALGGFSQEVTNQRSVGTRSYSFDSDELTYHSLQSGVQTDIPNSYFSIAAMQSFIFRSNYSLMDRYIFTLSFRADGSSKFVNNKWGYFPSGAFAWRINEESFMNQIDELSNLKLRLSYGKTGNQAIQPYQSLSTYAPVNYSLNGTSLDVAYKKVAKANPNLTWETTSQYNAGLDVGLWAQRLSFSVNYYFKDTRDLLQQVALAPSTGYEYQFQNAGQITNAGFEFDLKGILIKSKDYSLKMGVTLSQNINKIVSLGETELFLGQNTGGSSIYPFRLKAGESLGSIYGFQTNGVIQTLEQAQNSPSFQNNSLGELVVVDQNDDAVINQDDIVIIGNTNPKFIYGFTIDFDYKDFSLGLLLSGKYGFDILNMNHRTGSRLTGENPLKYVYENAWSPEIRNNNGEIVQPGNPNAKYSMIGAFPGRAWEEIYDTFVEDGSFIRLNSVRLSYQLNNIVRKLTSGSVRSGSVFVTASNLITWTNYKGYDPDVSVFGQDASRRGVDWGSYPPPRTFSFGLNFNL